MKKTPSKSSKHSRAFESLAVQALLSLLLCLHGKATSKTCCFETFLSITDLLCDLFLPFLNMIIMCFPAACVPAKVFKDITMYCFEKPLNFNGICQCVAFIFRGWS